MCESMGKRVPPRVSIQGSIITVIDLVSAKPVHAKPKLGTYRC